MPATANSEARTRSLLVLSLAGAALMAATVGLWVYYGSRVFFETIRAGIAACF